MTRVPRSTLLVATAVFAVISGSVALAIPSTLVDKERPNASSEKRSAANAAYAQGMKLLEQGDLDGAIAQDRRALELDAKHALA